MQAQQAVRKYFVSNAAYAAPIHSRDVRHIMLYKHAQAKQLVWVVVREIASATVYLYNARPHHPSRLMLYTYTKSHSRSLYHLPPPYAYSQYELKIATVQEKQHEKKKKTSNCDPTCNSYALSIRAYWYPTLTKVACLQWTYPPVNQTRSVQ